MAMLKMPVNGPVVHGVKSSNKQIRHDSRSPLLKANLALRLIVELAMFAGFGIGPALAIDGLARWPLTVFGPVAAMAWAELWIYSALLLIGTAIHYPSWPKRVRWLFCN